MFEWEREMQKIGISNTVLDTVNLEKIEIQYLSFVKIQVMVKLVYVTN